MGLFHTIFGMPNTIQKGETTGPKHTSFSSGKNTVSLTKGEVVKGEVTDLRSNEVTIRLEDGRILHARLSSAMELSIGQEAEFFVQETNDVLITLKLLSDGDTSFEESAIDKALEASGLPKSPHTVTLVRSLLSAGLPASKEMIQKMMQYSAANKGVEPSTLTALLKHNLPVTKENATQLQAYRNYEHRLIGQATTLTSTLTDAFSYGEASSSFTKGLLSYFFGDVSSSEDGLPLENTVTSEATVSSGQSAGSDPTGLAGQQELSGASSDATLPQALSVTYPEASPQPAFETVSTVPMKATVSTPADTASSISEEYLPLTSILSEKEYKTIGKVLDSISPETPELLFLKESLSNGTLSANSLFSFLSSAAETTDAAGIASLLKEEPVLSDLLGKTILNRFVLTPEDLTKEDAIREFYGRTQKDAAALTELASAEENSAVMKTIADTATNMQDNISFMNTLNQIFPYVQLPLKLTEQLTHGELFVYTKKKDLSAKNKEVSILLHLDMDALGPTDIHLSLLQQSVTARFYLNDPETGSLVSEELPALTEALQKKGYTLNASVAQRIKEPDIVTDFLEGGDAVSMKRFRFDIRA